jgi:SAM-dependent methyltransferase
MVTAGDAVRRPTSSTSAAGASGLAPRESRTNGVVAMPAPRWFFRFMYDRESAAWERRRDEPEHRELVERTADELANVLAPPGPVADLGCGPGAHGLALAQRGYDVVGVDGSPRMVEVARTRAARDTDDATFDMHDVSAPLRFADASLGGVLAIVVLQHLPHPAAFIAEIRRCRRPGGHLLITAPARDSTTLTSQNLYWRLRAACYHRVPRVVRFYDTNSLPRLVAHQGLTVVECNGEPRRERVGTRMTSLVESALQRRVRVHQHVLTRRCPLGGPGDKEVATTCQRSSGGTTVCPSLCRIRLFQVKGAG